MVGPAGQNAFQPARGRESTPGRLIRINAQFAATSILWSTIRKEGVMWWSDYWPMPGMLFGLLIMLPFAIVCLAMMFFMMRGGMTHRYRRRDAVDILKERYARGEINEAEYRERRRLLET
jgi:putative membrane protein